MIDRVSGEIALGGEGLAVGPQLTREQFLDSRIGRESRILVSNEPYCTFELPRVNFGGHSFAWSLSFCGSVLRSVSIACADPEFGLSWADWSEALEDARRRFHDSLLTAALGSDVFPYNFSWGSVKSFYDQIAGGSRIQVVYTT